jgi:hypothetical protein
VVVRGDGTVLFKVDEEAGLAGMDEVPLNFAGLAGGLKFKVSV